MIIKITETVKTFEIDVILDRNAHGKGKELLMNEDGSEVDIQDLIPYLRSLEDGEYTLQVQLIQKKELL